MPGVNPSADSTALDTIFFTDSDKVRFQFGKLRKQQGVQRVFAQDYIQILGYARNIYSYRDGFNNPITIIGTNTRLYAYLFLNGPTFYNITPLLVSTNAAANSLSTEYNTGTYLIQTTEGSNIVDLFIDQYFLQDDLIMISGVTDGPYGGIPASNFNGTFQVNVLSNTHIQINVSTTASSNTDDQVSMTWASEYMFMNYPGHNSIVGDRIKITGSTDVDGIPNANINAEHIITNIVDPNNLIFETGIFATSSVTGAGGTGINIQFQIAAGSADGMTTAGYGVGVYGKGNYGVGQSTSQSDQANLIHPRIWSMAVIGANLILTPGDPVSNSTDNLYLWQNDTDVAPVLVSSFSGANDVPLACRWVYESASTAVVLGSGGVLNRFRSSQAISNTSLLPIIWNVGPQTVAYSTIVAGASALISQAKSRNFDLVFTQSDVYLFEFVQKPNIWFLRKLFTTDGIIGPKARGVIEDSVMWQGTGDFYVFDGYSVNVLPNNTLKRYVYDNINLVHAWKSFAYVNVEWSEITFFYPAGEQTEPYTNVTFNYKELHWTPSKWERTAAEEYINVGQYPLLVDSNIIVKHPIPNRISTYFFDITTDAIGTQDGLALVTIDLMTDVFLVPGDQILISGATGVGGLTADQINGVQTITGNQQGFGYGEGLYGVGYYGASGRPSQDNEGYGTGAYGTGFYGGEMEYEETITFTASSNATSTEFGGGSNVKIGTRILGVAYNGNDISVDEVVTIANADNIDGFSSTDVNVTGPVRGINGGIFYINAGGTGFSTSAVTNGGGNEAVLILNEGTILYQHEVGLNDYNEDFNLATDPFLNQYKPLNAYAVTNYSQLSDGDNTMVLHTFYSDINQSGPMQLTVNMKEYAQSAQVKTRQYYLGPVQPKVDVQMIGRERQYTFRSNVLDGNFLLGMIYEEVKESTPR